MNHWLKIGLLCVTAMLLTVVLGIFFPWWTSAIPCFLLGVFFPKMKHPMWWALLLGFGILCVLWCGMAWLIDFKNNAVLSTKIIQLFSMPASYGWVLIGATGVVGGLVGGIAACFGISVQQLYLNSSHYEAP